MPKIPLEFPVEGLNEGAGYQSQPDNTTPSALNVRSRDAIKDRLRGGRRAGLSKWNFDRINGAAAIQSITKAVEAQATTTAITGGIFVCSEAAFGRELSFAGASIFTYAAGTIIVSGVKSLLETDFYYFGGQLGASEHAWKINSSGVSQWTQNMGSASRTSLAHDSKTTSLVVGGSTTTTWDGSGGASASIWRLDDSDGTITWGVDLATTINGIKVDRLGNYFAVGSRNNSWTGAGGVFASVWKLRASDGTILASYDPGANVPINGLAIGPENEILIGIVGTSTTWVGNDGSEKNIFILDSNLGSPLVANTYLKNNTTGNHIIAFDSKGNITVASDNNVLLSFNRAGTTRWSKDMGVRIFHSDSTPDGKVIVGGDQSTSWLGAGGENANILGLDEDTGDALWFFDTGSDIATGASIQVQPGREANVVTRESSIAVTAGGAIRQIIDGVKSTPTGLSDPALTTEPFRIHAANSFSDVFFVDGTNSVVLDLATQVTATWTATTAGTLPALARLIATYRGRIVLAGLVADPQNWFMSRVGDPYDWDYSPGTITALIPVAGNVGETGKVGDIITGLVAFSDDAMIIGGDHSIWQMSGDPAANGSIDMITNETGMAWDAWALDPNNTLYFMGIDGIYRMEVGEKPVNISLSILDRRFEDIDLSTHRVLLVWDYLRKGLSIVVTDSNTDNAVDGFFYSPRDNSWMPDEHPAAYGPDVMLAYDAEKADDKALLYGCRDGFIRQVDPTANDDDGLTITSCVRYPPVSPALGASAGRLQSISVVLAEGSGPVDLKVYAGQTAEQCVLSTTPRFKRVLTAGRNVVDTRRLRAPWTQIELGQTDASTPWAVETVHLDIVPAGKSRRHRI